ncbi:HNH endonuclease signature motif containing protein [Bacillus sp. FSL W7-1360]
MNESQRYYDKYKRDQESRRFYNSKAWQKARRLALNRDDHLCRHCFDNGTITSAQTVHHIKYLKDHPELALDLANLVSLCFSCHNHMHSNRMKPMEKRHVRVSVEQGNPERY